ncbi:MAG: SOS response-associated peptidase [Pseudomonadota bacterium]|nr:SOS response-associated peptidase [Pseudomonadota bacterium]
MCGRYAIADLSPEFAGLFLPTDFRPTVDARPTDPLPVVRRDANGTLMCELRRWGFQREWPGPNGKWIKRTLFNAVGEEVTQKRAFKQAFLTARCIVPLNAWYEWVDTPRGKQRYRLAMRERACFGAAGLFEVGKDSQSGAPTACFTMLTVAPGENSPLSNVHDRAPMILAAADYETWLDADAHVAQALLEPYPDQDAFSVEPYEPAPAEGSLF